ncbi:MAG: metal-dependent phosphohydrolase [Deltaproteobacteria bacterium]|nr:MAG: metal-dependent phosphohydrolase [Deltaproteobacteria bacterium]
MAGKIYIEQLKEGDSFTEVFAIKALRQGETKAGKPYLLLTLMDKTGEISCPVWNNALQLAEICVVGGFVRCSGQVASFRGQKQLQPDRLEAVAADDVSMADFLPETAGDRQAMARKLLKFVASVDDPWLEKLLDHFFGEGEIWQQFQRAAAAKLAHHACIGGLLEHTLSLVSVADSLACHYPGVNRDLLVAGALLHDIGKLEEMRFQGSVVEYTTPGRLKGHLVIGSEMVAAAALSIKGFPRDLLEQLQHLILSHHGRLDYGSPVLPMTVEAFLLSMLDDLDAKMNMIEQLRKKMAAGQYSFTEYQRLLERYLYLSGYPDKEKQKSEDAPAARRNQPCLWDS